MLVDFSFPTNASPSASLYSFSSINYQLLKCLRYQAVTTYLAAWTFTIILIVLPLCIFVLYLGLQRWRQQRSRLTVSHSDLFTYHMVIMELIGVFSFILMCCGIYTFLQQLIMVGIYLYIINFSGQMMFHILTCVERYLAVVHPVTYLSLRGMKGIRIRNITIGCVWLLSFAGPSLMHLEDYVSIVILFFSSLAFALIVISFCSLSVLSVLIRQGPGVRQQADQSKLRAFYTIAVIMGVLLIRFGGNVLTRSLYASLQASLGESGRCAVWLSFIWLCLPSSLVLPLLFLQRAGKLRCCKKNNESGQESD